MNPKQKEAANKYQEIELLDNETLSMLMEYAAGNPEILKDILDSFEPEASVLIEEIKKAVQQGNETLLRTASHSLGGISGAIGAKRLKQVCADTENAIKAGSFDLALQNTPHIFDNYEKIIERLKNF